MKGYLLAAYWIISLMICTVELSSDRSIKFYVIYYSIALLNLAIATKAVNKYFKRNYNANKAS